MRRWITALALGSLHCSDYKFSDVGPSRDGAEEDSGLDTEGSDGPDGADTGSDPDPDPDPEGECETPDVDGAFFGFTDACPTEPEGGFTPIVEWEAGAGRSCFAQPVVGDLDGDGNTEVVLAMADLLSPMGGTAELWVLDGATGNTLWTRNAQMGHAAAPALGDVDGDGYGDIVVVKEYENSLLALGSYSVVLYSHEGVVIWESDRFTGDDMDYAAAPVLADMDHDGFTEIVVGRVILNHDGTTSGVGSAGRGSFGGGLEGALPAVADLDLDGQDEVIVGNAMYNHEGGPVWVDFTQSDGLIAVANLDDDEAGEIVVSTGETVRAMDTDGSVMWGPLSLPEANIVSPAAIGDIDADGEPEIIVAGGNAIWALDRDGNLEWSADATDMTGATGASLFDFEGDGIMEVVYIDEVQMVAFDGLTGAIKFLSTDHTSPTMYDYPTIADVDGDDQAEILVCHAGHSSALSAYGDQDESWATARSTWNQHAYSITNINDDLSIPSDPTPNFTLYNNWHTAIDRESGYTLADDVTAQIADVCTDECDAGRVIVQLQLINLSYDALAEDVSMALYAMVGGSLTLVAVIDETWDLEPGWASEGTTLEIDAAALEGATELHLVADDDGTGTGILSECAEDDNTDTWSGPFCD